MEYIRLIAHIKYKEGSDEGKHYVYEKLLLILKGKVASYIMELQKDMLSKDWRKSKQAKFQKVITYDWDKYWEFYTTQSKNNDFFLTGAISLNLFQKINA